MADIDLFKHSTPDLYDRYMAPLFFGPYARIVADRVSRLRPERVLETAAGTGVLTQMISDGLPRAEIIATDVNPAVVDFAAKKLGADQVTVQQANAQELRSRTTVSTWCCAISARCSFQTRSGPTAKHGAS